MTTLDVPAQEVRLSSRVVEALAQGQPVTISRYGRRLAVLVSTHQFDLIAPLLELLAEGATVSPELLKTEADLALEHALAHDEEPSGGEDAQIAELLEASRPLA